MHKSRIEGNEKARKLIERSGYKMGGDVKQDAAMIHKHESHLHKGEPKTKFKDGGSARNKYSTGGTVYRDDTHAESVRYKDTLEKPKGRAYGTYKDGGRTKKEAKVNITIVTGQTPSPTIPPDARLPMPRPQQPMPMPPVPPQMPGTPAPMPGMKTGGRAKPAVHMTAGALGAASRPEKKAAYGEHPAKYAAGGKVTTKEERVKRFLGDTKMQGGSGGALSRLEKIKAYGEHPAKHKKGGKC